jgi:uncharacterized protein YndB with AHSA1/START domain
LKVVVGRTINVAAPLEKVWAAVTEPRHIAAALGEGDASASALAGRFPVSRQAWWPAALRSSRPVPVVF